ncbi:DUF4192 domain-containing protein [Nocardia sp. NPDC050435]|uniref:DUF4192 domain-containing protein n=1 Tax=Nocardia sp. NPDC050435 TaxID=3155040 RepID=UPI0033F0A66F
MARALRIASRGELITAIPPLLGFVPHRSLVAVVLRKAEPPGPSPIIASVARFDLDPPAGGPATAEPIAAVLARMCAAEQAAAVLAVAVDDRAVEPPSTPNEFNARAAELIGELDKRLAPHEVLLAGAWAVSTIEAGVHWWPLLDRPGEGVLPDPGESVIAFAHVLDGRPIHASRTNLSAILAPDPSLAAQVAACLAETTERARQRCERAVRHGELDAYHRTLLEQVLWQVAHTAAGEVAPPAAIAELVAALRVPIVRGALFALAYTEHAAAAEQLWVRTVQGLPGPERADAATLLGFGAYVRGAGTFAGMALDAALAADPRQNMASMLEFALRSGMRTGALRRIGSAGHAMAADLGIDLGLLRS